VTITGLVPWTPNAFLEQYPEFKYAGAMLPRALADASARVDPEHFGTSTSQVIGLMAAIALAGSPFAQTQKQDPAGEAKITEYKERLAAIKREKRVAFIVL